MLRAGAGRCFSTGSRRGRSGAPAPRRQGKPPRRPAENSLKYVSSKVLEEMVSLHASDPARWTSAALAARYGAAPAMTDAALKLAALRKSQTIDDRRRAVADTWARLAIPAGARRGEATSTPPPSPGKASVMPRFDLIDSVFEAAAKRREELGAASAPEAAGEDAEHEEAAAEGGEGDTKEGETNDDSFAGRSPVAEWVDGLTKSGGEFQDVRRNTSFAFIEAGLSNSPARAVWIRDGSTGRIRSPTDVEREHLLGGRAIRRRPTRKV